MLPILIVDSIPLKHALTGNTTHISVLIAANDRERAQLGYALHDSVAQTLVAIRFQVMALEQRQSDNGPLAEQLRNLRDSLAVVLEEVRLLSLRLHPRIVDDLGLLAALRQLIRPGKLHATVTLASGKADEDLLRQLPGELSRVLYQVAQESLDNAERHSAASMVEISIAVASGVVSLHFADNGSGFDTSLLDDPMRSTGLLLIRERLLALGGTLAIESAPAHHTIVRAEIALPDSLHRRDWRTTASLSESR